MSIKNKEDVIGLKKIGKIVGDTIKLMKSSIKPGMTTKQLDLIGAKYFSSFGAKSAPILTYNFPGFTCISVNDEIAHGIPGSRILKNGDLVNIDVSLELDGYFADAGATFCVNDTNKFIIDLCNSSKEILYKAINGIKAGNKLNRIGRIIENESKILGFKTINNLAGHGVGRALHEEPDNLVNYYNPADQRLATDGMVVAIETFISTGAKKAIQKNDGWTLTTHDKSFVAQFEHSIIITRNEPIILTA